MCGRYSLNKTKIELEERFQAEMLVDFHPRYNIAPTQLVPVITSDSPKGFSFFYWGITPDFGQNKPVSPKLINARAESVHEKVTQHTFLILTTSPNEQVNEVHDRMPVILPRNQEKKWLDTYSSEEELLAMLQPYPSDLMQSYTVSPLVNSVQNDTQSILRRTSPMDQFGNYTLFG